jgi:hypothetical protein
MRSLGWPTKMKNNDKDKCIRRERRKMENKDKNKEIQAKNKVALLM